MPPPRTRELARKPASAAARRRHDRRLVLVVRLAARHHVAPRQPAMQVHVRASARTEGPEHVLRGLPADGAELRRARRGRAGGRVGWIHARHISRHAGPSSRRAARSTGFRRRQEKAPRERFARGFVFRGPRVPVQLTATGASASISVTTSMTTGRSASIALASAVAKSDGFSTRMPSAPISCATRAKLTCV